MGWRELVRKRFASFRGAGFMVSESESRVGRRTVLHEYPQRDEPFTEDLGRRARQFVVEAHVIGEDYIALRDQLIWAIEQPGPGWLEHPRWGSLWVVVQDYVTVKEGHQSGGIAKFSITFVQHGENRFPSAIEDTISQVDAASEATDTAASTAFAEAFSVDGPGLLETTALDAFQDDLEASLGLARQVMSTVDLADWMSSLAGVTGTLSALLRTPVQLAQSLAGLNVQLVTALNRPLQALAELEALFAGNDRPTSQTSQTGLTGGTQTALTGNETARADLQRSLAITAGARTLAVAITTEGLTAAQARQLRDRQLALIDHELEVNDPPPAVVRTLAGLRSAITRDVQERAEQLRQVASFTPATVLPSVVLAHRIYQDATRADELVQRNAVRHPAFVPAAPLEVLR